MESDKTKPLLTEYTDDITKQRHNQICCVKRREVCTAMCACLGPFSLGFALGYSSPSLPDLQRAGLLISHTDASWYGSSMTLGALLGGPIAGWTVNQFGRRTTIIMLGLPYTLGWLFLAAANGYSMLIVGRVLTGLAGGATSLCVPLFIAEITSKEMRGRLGAAFQIGTTSGILVVYSLGLFLPWRWLAVVSAIPPVCLTILALLMPETPRWLLLKHRKMEAVRTLEWLRNEPSGSEGLVQECMDIETAIEEEKEEVSWRSFTSPSLYRPLIISICLMVLQQFSGINAVIFYTETLFEQAHYNGSPGVPAVTIAAVKVVATCISTSLMDRVGRRILFITGGIFMALSCTTFGLYFYLTDNQIITQDLSWMSLASLIVYVIAFSLGWGAIPWLIMSEIFPVRAKGKASAVATAVNWLGAFLVTVGFLPVQNVFHPYGTFWSFGVVCLIGTIYAFLILPETKGKSLEEIESYFRPCQRISAVN